MKRNVAVRCTGLSKYFGVNAAIKDVSLELEKGGFLALLGPSGCGKTTLLRLIAGFETPEEGTIEVNGRTVSGPGTCLEAENRHVGIVFQDYALFPHMDVARNIAYGLPNTADRRRRVDEMLSLVGLTGLGRRMPHQLSGGEQQRVALARALAPSPALILLDEPFSNLDADLRTRIRAEVKDILTATGVSVIFVTHDQQEALYMGDYVGVMNKGKMEQIDTPRGIFDNPVTPFVAGFVGAADFINGTVSNGIARTGIGDLRVRNNPAATAVSVLVRPISLDIHPDLNGPGIITERIFQGGFDLYYIRLETGETVRSLQDCDCQYPIGERVAVLSEPAQTFVVYPKSVG